VIWPNDSRASSDRSSLLKDWTTLGVGGPAERMCFPERVEDVCDEVRGAEDAGRPWRPLGRGSNLVVDDDGVDGTVIHTRSLRGIRFAEDGRVVAGAGLPTSVLLAQTRCRGLGGLEPLVGYPASVGGAARMNAGGAWGEIRDVIESVVAVGPGGEVVEVAAADCRFGYRTSALAGRVVVEVVFRLPEVDPDDYRLRIEAILAKKAAAQPLDEASAGCVFRNPGPGISAGRLVDECDLLDHRRGGAVVSPKHGNFIVNRGGATAADVLGLIDEVREAVSRRAGVDLRLEVEVWRRNHVPAHA